MGRLDFGRSLAPRLTQHLHNDVDAVDGDEAESL